MTVSSEKKQEFLIGTRGSQFVFCQEIKEYIDEIWKKSIELESWTLNQTNSENSGLRVIHLNWFNDQMQNIDIRFNKYMQLSHKFFNKQRNI